MRIKGFLAPQRNASRGWRNVINQTYKTKADLSSGYLKLASFSWKNTENLLLKEEFLSYLPLWQKGFSPLKTWTCSLMSSWRLILKPFQMSKCHADKVPGKVCLCAAPECEEVFCQSLLELHQCGMQACSALSCWSSSLCPMQPLPPNTKEPPNQSQTKHSTSENPAKRW